MSTRGPGTQIVRRDRLVSKLVESSDTTLVLIDAPAGFGKSTLLSEWRDADSRSFATLTLGERHDDPVLLTASIAGAVAKLAPVDEEVYAALYGSRPGTLKVAVPRLLECLRESGERIVLALDDVHALHDHESLQIVASIANDLPAGSQIALASRHEPALRLSRLRANRSLTELGATDLAFTEAEATELLRQSGLILEPTSVELLVQRTEGWPAALYLATLSLATADDPDQAAREFAGDHRMVADYLRDELISSLDPDQLDFIIRTSILDEVSGEIADQVLATEGSAARLRSLARTNALVLSLDDREHVFRYHALLREMLRADLRRDRPDQEAALHASAASWYEANGDFDRAVPHRIESGDLDAAAELIWSQTATYSSAGREATLERWLAEFTGPQIESNPYLCLVRATCALSTGDGAAVEHWTGRALGMLNEEGDDSDAATAIAARSIRAAGSAREGVVQMRLDAVAAFEMLPDDAQWRALCRFVEGAALHLTGRLPEARLALADGARRGAIAVPSLRALCSVQLALIEADDEDPDEAVRLVELAVRIEEINALADQPTQALVFAVAAHVLAKTGEYSKAGTHARHGLRMLEQLVEISPWYEAECRIVIARALAQLDDVDQARSQLAIAGRLMRYAADAPVLDDWLQRAWKEADASRAADRWPLSPAELRLLHQLPTHLSFREIAERSFVSTNTVKTQARSIYRKLGVGSRAEAVSVARTAGLLDSGSSSTAPIKKQSAPSEVETFAAARSSTSPVDGTM